MRREDVIVTAHSAHYSDSAAAEVRKRPWEEVSRIIKGEWPRGLVNPEVQDKYAARWRELPEHSKADTKSLGELQSQK